MTRVIVVAVLSLGAVLAPLTAQTLGDAVVSQYTEYKKSRAAVRVCTHEEGRMQIERNEHYDALLRANAKDPAFPTIEEKSQAQAQLRIEDEALAQKRDECSPLFDQLLAATKELQRVCDAFIALNPSDDRPAGAPAIGICRGSARPVGGDKLGSQ